MYEAHREASYTNLSYYSTQPLPLAISNPPHYHHSLSSDSSFSHHPPPIPLDPYPNPPGYSGLEDRPAYFQDPGVDSSRWVVKQAGPVKYSPIVQPVTQESVPSTTYATPFLSTWVGQNSITNGHKRKLKRPKANPMKRSAGQSVKCELCKIECTSIQLYEKHLSGRKHAKSLQKLYAPMITSQAGQASQSINKSCSSGVTRITNLETKKQKLLEGGTAAQSLRICAICNVACNGEIAFADHMAGKKHLAQERALATLANPISTSATNPKPKSNEATTPKPKNTEPVWCEVCKISCTSFEGLNIHKEGKKHKKNVEKSQNPKTVDLNVAPPVTAGPPPPGKSKEPEDMETKKRKVLECGAAEDAVRTCTICNVVCNSETVFNSHLSGQKHAAMVKQKQDEEEAASGNGNASNAQSQSGNGTNAQELVNPPDS